MPYYVCWTTGKCDYFTDEEFEGILVQEELGIDLLKTFGIVSYIYVAKIPTPEPTPMPTPALAQVADIIEVEAPIEAVSGANVFVDVRVKNLGLAPGGYNDIAVTGKFNSSLLSWQFSYLSLAPQQIVVFQGSFIMPANSVTATIWTHYWDGSKWVLDETTSVNIALATPVVVEFRSLQVVYSRG